MIVKLIKYETISPAVLEQIVISQVPNTYCFWREYNEDIFEFEVGGYIPFRQREINQVQDILARYE